MSSACVPDYLIMRPIDRVMTLSAAHGWSLRGLSALSRVDKATLSRARDGKESLTDLAARRLAVALDVPAPWILGYRAGQMVALEPHWCLPGDNPRQDLGDVDGLADSLFRDGQLEPLGAVAIPEAPGHVRLLYGHRRRAAALLLIRSGRWHPTRALNVLIKDAVSPGDALMLGLLENLGREDMHPLDEAEAFRTLTEAHGTPTASIAERLGRSQRWVQGRLKLAALTPDAREAFRAGAFSLAQAEVLAAASAETQAKALPYVGTLKTEAAVRELLADVEAPGEGARAGNPDPPAPHQGDLIPLCPPPGQAPAIAEPIPPEEAPAPETPEPPPAAQPSARDHEEFETGPHAIRVLLGSGELDTPPGQRWLWWEPCAGPGRLLDTMAGYGLTVVGSTLHTGRPATDGRPAILGDTDFFALASEQCPPVPRPPLHFAICTNGPYSKNETFIRRALALRPRRLILHLPYRMLWGKGRAAGLWADHPPTRLHIIAPRDTYYPSDWEGERNDGKDDHFWAVWDLAAPPAAGPTVHWPGAPADSQEAMP